MEVNELWVPEAVNKENLNTLGFLACPSLVVQPVVVYMIWLLKGIETCYYYRVNSLRIEILDFM